uniref:Go opsin n=1 Tax=Branchiostoma belcheri TaxID=7741 RepID=A0A455ZB48_BRABE|nr:TPA_exp: Go opsin [Branchiostoma belcheri]
MFNDSAGNSNTDGELRLWHYDGEFLDKSHIQPLTTHGYLATAIYLTILGCIATLGNGSVIVVYARQKKFRSKPHNILILNLAISDLGISIFGYPFCTASGYAGYWLFGDAVCQLYGFMCYTLSMSSLNTLVVIAGFRYISLCRPQYAYKLTHRVTAYSLIGVWLYSLLWTVPPLVGWSSYTYELFGTSCSIKWTVEDTSEMVYVIGSCLFCYLVHLLLLVFFYYKIAKRMRKLNLRGQHAVPTASGRRDFVTSSRMQSETRATMMCFLMVILFMVAWTPYTVSSFWSTLVNEIPLWAATYPTMFAKSSCVFNPLIYAVAHKKFRSFLTQTCCPWLYRRVGLGKNNPYLDQQRQNRIRKQKGQIFCVQYTHGNVYIGAHGSRGCWSEDSGRIRGTCRYHRARSSFSTLHVDNLARLSQGGASSSTDSRLPSVHRKGRKYTVQAQIEPAPRQENSASSSDESVDDMSCIDFTVI